MGTAGSEDKTSDPAHPAQDNIDPFDRDFGPGQDRDSVIYQVSGMLLGYPSEELVQTLPELIRLAQATEDDEFTQAVQTVANWMTAQDLEDVQSEYVQEYDLSRRHAPIGRMATLAAAVRRCSSLSRCTATRECLLSSMGNCPTTCRWCWNSPLLWIVQKGVPRYRRTALLWSFCVCP